jgi:[ribosomal protein S18]-alanine N-acetyltransferase
MTVTIERARPADHDAVLTLEDLSPSTRRLLGRDLTADDRCCLVARDVDGRIVGLAVGALQVDDAHLFDLSVASAVRRRGIGAQLVRALDDELRARGAVAMTLEVRPSNAAARVLYRRLGFVEEGRRPRYYPDGEDALLLWRREAS